MRAHLILGNQLFEKHPALESDISEPIVMIESKKASQRYRYHKLKLVFMFAAMRGYRDELVQKGRRVIYVQLSDNSITEELTRIINENKIDELTYMQPADRDPREKLSKFFTKSSIRRLTVYPSMLHITEEKEFADWYKNTKTPIMEKFYRNQRVRLNVLMDGTKPIGGKWNYDTENRKPLPKKQINIPRPIDFPPNQTTKDVISIVEKEFSDNPGEAREIWFPINREQARLFLNDFIEHRLEYFGIYEDAFREGEPFLYHSCLSALINVGLLSVNEVLNKVLAKSDSLQINTIEGYVRQLIGWREYIYGVYWNMPKLKSSNYFGFKKALEDYWYEIGDIKEDLPVPVLSSLRTLNKFAYNHHIERLMVLGNWFLLNNYNPNSVNEWFMSMYIDAYEWVMIPNVIGMSQYADGGRIATKPYISGDNYLYKMGAYQTKPIISRYTDLYWKFLFDHKEKLRGNFRMQLAINTAIKKYAKN